MDIDIPNNPSVKLVRDSWIRAAASGLFHMNASNGAHVRKNDLLGVICNPFGEVEHKILSPVDAYIVGVNNQPVVNEGDALIHLGMED